MNERLEIFDSLRDSSHKVIDTHAHAGFDATNIVRRRYPIAQSIVDMTRKMQSNGISFTALFPSPSDLFWFDARKVAFEGIWEQATQPAERFPYEHANIAHFTEVELFGNGKIMPFANILPGVKETEQLELLKQLRESDRLFGLKLHTLATHTHATKLIGSRFTEFAYENSLPIMVHSGADEYSRPNLIVEVAKKYPEVRICIAHTGDYEKDLFKTLTSDDCPNLFTDLAPHITNCYFANQRKDGLILDLDYAKPRDVIMDIYKLIPYRLLWGTDEPWTTVTDGANQRILTKVLYEDEINLLNSLPELVQTNISYTNTMRYLFGSDLVPN